MSVKSKPGLVEVSIVVKGINGPPMKLLRHYLPYTITKGDARLPWTISYQLLMSQEALLAGMNTFKGSS